jgi:hypothetical protein
MRDMAFVESVADPLSFQSPFVACFLGSALTGSIVFRSMDFVPMIATKRLMASGDDFDHAEGVEERR